MTTAAAPMPAIASTPAGAPLRAPGWGARLLGRPFLHPLADYLLVAGGLSLLVLLPLQTAVAPVLGVPSVAAFGATPAAETLFLLFNAAHFASSTARLYTKPHAVATWPFLTLGFPLLTVAALAACILTPQPLGLGLQSLYLTWSPYHYAAQAYGVAVLFTFRAGCRLHPTDKRLLWWAAMPPFLFTLLTNPNPRTGLRWLLPDAVGQHPVFDGVTQGLGPALTVLAFAAPLAVAIRVWRRPSGPLPLTAPLALLANAFWWTALDADNAFYIVAIFHSIQYLALVLYFDVKDNLPAGADARKAWRRAVGFYVGCTLLGYTLFQLVPRAFVFSGLGLMDSVVATAAIINVHHFIVDAFIWRLKPADSNRAVVTGAAA